MAETKAEKQAAAVQTTHVVEEAEKVVPSKDDAGYETPSGYALAKVGEGGDGEKYAQEKAKKRWGH